jgi:hypothetical protein
MSLAISSSLIDLNASNVFARENKRCDALKVMVSDVLVDNMTVMSVFHHSLNTGKENTGAPLDINNILESKVSQSISLPSFHH